MVWKGERAGGLDFVAVSTTPIGSAFPAPGALTPDTDDNFIRPQVAVSPSGDAIVAWVREVSATEEVVEAAVRSGGVFAPTQELDRGPLQAFGRPVVAIAPSGEALLLWGRAAGGSSTLRLSVRAPGATTLSAPDDIAALAGFPQVAIDGERAVIAWSQRNVLNPIEAGDPPNSAASAVVHVAIRPPGGPVGPAVAISGSSPIADLRLRRVAVDADGAIVVGWERYLDVSGNGVFELARRPPGGPFDPPVPVTAINRDTQAVNLGVLPSGEVLTAWTQILGPDDAALRSSIVSVLPDAATAASDVCAPAPPTPASGPARPAAFALTAAQFATNQRIGQAAIRRLNAVRDWLDAGVETRDLCGGTIGPADLAPGISSVPRAVSLTTLTAPDPRPLQIRPAAKRPGSFTRSARQLLFNQRIYQAAVRRANALERRLNGGLTGGDLQDGSLSQAKLQDRLRITGIVPVPAAAVSRTLIAGRSGAGSADDIDFSVRQVRINQRVAQAAVRRANALRARIQQGLTGAQFANGTIGGDDLAPDALP